MGAGKVEQSRKHMSTLSLLAFPLHFSHLCGNILVILPFCGFNLSLVWYSRTSDFQLALFLDAFHLELDETDYGLYPEDVPVKGYLLSTRWFKYDRDYLCVNKSQFVPVIFEPPFTTLHGVTPRRP
jgi:hypothetical protein